MPSSPKPRALFVQPFGIGAAGGGSRILRSMIKGQPFEKLSINSDPYPSPGLDWIEERHVSIRPRLGRLDRGRFSRIGHALEVLTRAQFKKKLTREIDAWKPNIVHVLPHWSSDFHLAWRAARARGCRVVMSVHDDLAYALPVTHPLREEALQMLGKVWRDVDHIFAISQELGDAYCGRYGEKSFEIITDGIDHVPTQPLPLTKDRLHIRFIGLFHHGYRENLRVLTRVLARLKKEQPSINVDLSLRCGNLEKGLDSAFPAHVLPFASQEVVLDDMAHADLLYLPLPFGAAYEGLTRHSLSTKMVSYLGSGVPILFHGPGDSAAGRLLARHQAALCCHSLDDSDMLGAIKFHWEAQTRVAVVENALNLARKSFPMEALRHKFFSGLVSP